jgi:hypothetical protein
MKTTCMFTAAMIAAMALIEDGQNAKVKNRI